MRAGEIEEEIKSGKKYPFDSLVYCNIGNPQQLNQKPLTFVRQVLALTSYPGLEKIVPEGTFPSDVVERAHRLLKSNPGGSGAYSNSQGIPEVLKDVAEAIGRRDGYPCNPKEIYLSNGASQSVQNALMLLSTSPNDGFLTPIPQYPLYSATITLYGTKLIGYYLNEEKDWGLDMNELETRLEEAKAKGINLKGMVIINPGNPTGMCLGEEEMRECIRFCIRNKLVLLADEVYQENIYVPHKKFVSFRKVALDMGEEAKNAQIISFHSISKGFFGECGRRGGYLQAMGFDPEVFAQITKMWSINLCANTDGQIALDCMVNPPREGDPSYPLYIEEKSAILASLQRRAVKLVAALSKLPGITCNQVDGSLYIFFKVVLPKKAVEAAKQRGVAPDFLYCEEMLQQTGIVTVPGSGFQQKDGTYHVRTTILPQESEIDKVIERMDGFQHAFMKKYED